MSNFQIELRQLINRNSLENDSNTPDYILAKYLEGCLELFNKIIHERDDWHGYNPSNPKERNTIISKPPFDWATVSYDQTVRCKINLRTNYQGREIKPGLQALNGEIAFLRPLWLMGEDDPYSGEWALGCRYNTILNSGVNWIASGDVIPLV